MKTTTFFSLFLAGMILQGCAGGSIPGDGDESLDGADDIEASDRDQDPAPAAEAVDAKIATVDVPGGQVIFVDEGLTEPGAGIAFWELGGADLSYLLDVENATALEIYMALAPEAVVPERLVEHHAEVSRRVGGVPARPRRFVLPSLMPEHQALTNEGLNDNGSGSNCWGWGGTNNAYSVVTGYQSFSLATFQSNFNTQYSQITGSAVSQGTDSATSYFPELGDSLGPTTAGHERAMAFCLSEANPVGGDGDCTNNRGKALVTVRRTNDAAYENFVNADSILLDHFGHGGRFRSNYTNSGGGARKYDLFVEWQTHAVEGGQSIHDVCADQLVLAWRSKQDLGGPGGFESP